jgi:hypothetical protein
MFQNVAAAAVAPVQACWASSLQFVRPHQGILELSVLATKLRKRALERAFRLFATYSKGLHDWIDTAATGDQLAVIVNRYA